MKVTLRNALAGIAASLAVFSAVSCSNGELSGPGSSGPDAVSGPAVYEPDGAELPDGGDDNPTEEPVEITLPESVVFHYVHDTTNVILSKAYSSSKDAGITATANDDGTFTVTNNDYVVFKTDKSADGSFTFYDETEKKYLSIGSDGYLAAVETLNEYSYWTLTAVEGGYNIVNDKADKYLENYNGFTVYTYNSKYPYNYVIDLLDSKKVKYEEAPVVKITLPESVVFHYVYDTTNVILSTAYSSSKDAGIAATANEDGSLTVASKDYVTFAPVQNEDDGTFTFYDEAGKKYLSATSKGYLAAAEEADEYSHWNLTVVDGGGYNVKNAKSGKCLEYYGGFTTYNYNSSYPYNYVIDLLDATKVTYSENPAEYEPGDDGSGGELEDVNLSSDSVVFHYVYGTTNVLLSNAFGSSKDTGVEATANEDGSLSVTSSSYAVFVPTKISNAMYTFYMEDSKKYLSCNEKGYPVYVGEADEYSYWLLIKVGDGYYISNANTSKFFEYYKGFTTYDFQENYSYDYVIDLLDASKVKYNEAAVENKDTVNVSSDLSTVSSEIAEVTVGNLKFEFDAGSNKSNSPVFWAKDSTLRIYGGNTFTVSTVDKQNIEKVVFTFSKYAGLTCGESTLGLDNATWEAGDEDVSSVTFTASSKTFITKIEVYYKD